MNDDGGALSFATGVDTSGYDEGMQHMEEATQNLTASVEQQSSKIADLLNDIPEVNLSITTQASDLETIERGLQEVDRVVDANTKGIRELEAEFNRLGKVGAAAFKKATPEGDKVYQQCEKERAAIKQVIAARKKAIDEAGKEGDALLALEAKLKTQAQAVTQNAEKQTSLRQRLRELKMELVEMEAAGQRGTAAYRAIQEETAALTDAMGDAQAQANILANDQRGFAGVMSGLSGLSGAMTAATGAVSLFGSENEDLQKIMMRLQAVMSITMGLQQVQQTLNKDSAFSLVTLNGLKEWWNKLLAVGAGEQAAATAAEVADTAAQTADATATTANAAAHEAKAVAAGEAAVATGTDTVATGANAAAAGAGTAANISLAGAFRMVGVAISSIPVFGWIAAAIGVLIGVISHFVNKAKAASQAVKEQNEMLKESRKVYAEASAEVRDYQVQIEDFNGTQEQEQHLVEELNGKYGEHLGYCKTLGEWKAKLAEKGEAYCEMMMMEAEAQAILSKATDAYINLLEVKAKAESGEYDHWYNTKAGDAANRRKHIDEAQAEVDRWQNLYQQKRSAIRAFSQENDLGFHADPSKAVTIKGDSGKTFDPKEAARQQRDALRAYQEAVKSYIKQANDTVTADNIAAMDEGLQKELAQSRANTQARIQQWQDGLRQLAKARKEYEHEVYMAQKGATEEGWLASDQGKKSEDDYMAEILADPANLELAQQYQGQLTRIEEDGARERWRIQTEYSDKLVEQYGSLQERIDVLERKRISIYNDIPKQYQAEAERQLDEAIAALKSEGFKSQINWDVVFGDMGKQSIEVLKYNLDKVKAYFEANKDSMSVEQIKDYQEAITKLENEIAARNPFAALHKSLKDISAAKQEFSNACTAYSDSQRELTDAQNEYNAALEFERSLQAQTDENGNVIREQQEGYAEACEATALALSKLNQAEAKSGQAEQRMLTARNSITVSYKNFASQLKSCGGVVKDLGGKAQKLASIFSDDIADSIGKAIDFTEEMLDATGDVLGAIGDLGKGVAKGVDTAVEATSQGTTAAAAAGASAISTIEKASVILTVISAALQIATAIANLFNNDDKKEKEIERLQGRIDQLQWELDNPETVRMQEKVGKAIDNLRNIYAQASAEVLRLHGITEKSSLWEQWIARARYQGEIYTKTVENLADAYAKVNYAADKALGKQKYENSRKDLENYAEQMLLIQKQMNEENSKKKTDSGKVQEYERQIEEIGQKMAALINEMLEDIIGYTAEDIAKELGDAFFEAAKAGEDAMEAWGQKVNEIVADVMKRMLITKFLEEPLGEIFNKYKEKWFGTDGKFKGIDAVINSMQGFSDDLNGVGEAFAAIWAELPDSIKDFFPDESEREREREGQSRGIATASQDSVDENNARLTTIQGHTYTLVQGLQELNRTSNSILERLTGIEDNTKEINDKIDNVNGNVKKIHDAVDDIATKGIKLK